MQWATFFVCTPPHLVRGLSGRCCLNAREPTVRTDPSLALFFILPTAPRRTPRGQGYLILTPLLICKLCSLRPGVELPESAHGGSVALGNGREGIPVLDAICLGLATSSCVGLAPFQFTPFLCIGRSRTLVPVSLSELVSIVHRYSIWKSARFGRIDCDPHESAFKM